MLAALRPQSSSLAHPIPPSLLPLTRTLSLALLAYLTILLPALPTARADYYIDDTNSTLTYTTGPKTNATWGAFSANGPVEQIGLPNGTLKQIVPAWCVCCLACLFVDGGCASGVANPHIPSSESLTANATGSGIQLYVLQVGAQGINASATIDQTGPTHSSVLLAPEAPSFQKRNQSLFDIQGLPSEAHTLAMRVLDFQGAFSGMVFDYAYVSEASVVDGGNGGNRNGTSSGGGSGTGDTGTGESHVPAIVGGVIGALAVVGLLIAAFLILRRRSRARECKLHIDPFVDATPSGSNVNSSASSPLPPFIYDIKRDPYESGNTSRTTVPSRETLGVPHSGMAHVSSSSSSLPYHEGPQVLRPGSLVDMMTAVSGDRAGGTQQQRRGGEKQKQARSLRAGTTSSLPARAIPSPVLAAAPAQRTETQQQQQNSDALPRPSRGPWPNEKRRRPSTAPESQTQTQTQTQLSKRPLPQPHPARASHQPSPLGAPPSLSLSDSSPASIPQTGNQNQNQTQTQTQNQDLTEAQTEFVHGLYGCNVPAPAIARVGDWVYEAGLVPVGGLPLQGQLERPGLGRVHSGSPPSYEYARR
ncbi:hypothetical protein CONPUDRAFT_70285 [Coniophora puteana RWD-64-598 SS2]|uniref:Uncharacterized protein n=1 Tax=Coniophora puteana (strain RWD-64-598) TaxID=741705 RepID=A0A5M3N276_CONPW|nr:uncharacterized protein CONPUDRAFT_70285 [Coniophora puteana RWD-64-598 SS2]EIW85490.1 hypothetical protein CONPUDRAFT_70285 [Coniophora puteana RWD-64-598 SS2]